MTRRHELSAACMLVLFSMIGQGADGREFTFVNQCNYPVWAGALPPVIKNGGWEMRPGFKATFNVPNGFSGRFWGRSHCAAQGNAFVCETGDCGRKLECAGAGGIPPATLAEFTLNGWQGLDYYDISNVDGYNLPMAIMVGGQHNPSDGKFTCENAGCVSDLNAICPSKLQVKDKSGSVVACMSACEKFNTDQYCCRGAYGIPSKCNPEEWPIDYAAIFKKACPKAYSYAYDDHSSTFTCKGANPTYSIVFCPNGLPPVTGSPATGSPPGPGSCAIRQNADINGGAGLNSVSGKSFGECCGVCKSTSGCKAYAWNDYNGGAQCKTQANKDINGGGGLNPVHGKKESECCQICFRTSGCVAYAWNSFMSGTCWLKTAANPLINKSGVSVGVLIG